MERAIAFVILLLISPAAYAATHVVGDTSGWNTGVNYAGWASGQTFRAGDTLVFNFNPSQHAVDEVNRADYQSCNLANPINSQTTSPATVNLTAPGTRYFICPRSNHCQIGMKLAVTVAAAGGSTPTTPAAGGPLPPSTETPSPPPPPGHNGATSILGGRRINVIAGLSLVLAAFLG